MKKEKFAKLFDMPDGGQLLIMKSVDDGETVIKITTMFEGGVEGTLKIGLSDSQDADEVISTYDAEKATVIYDNLKI
jgi:hypothetical protein